MNVIIVPIYSISPHFESFLEIAQNHLDNGDTVTYLACNANLKTCEYNVEHFYGKCLKCILKRKKAIKLLSKKITVKPLIKLNNANKLEIEKLHLNFTSLSDLKEYKIDNFDIGYGILSSIISKYKDPYPDLNKYRKLINKYILSSFQVYRSIQNHLVDTKYDIVYLYNGRFSTQRAVLRACQKMKVLCYAQDRGSSNNKYYLYKNTLPHNIDYATNEIKKIWSKEDNYEKKTKIASEYFHKQSNFIFKNLETVEKDKKKGFLPENWDKSKRNIIIYNTSENEFQAIGKEWDMPFYKNQYEGTKQIVSSLMLYKDNIDVYLRLHPNSPEKYNKDYYDLECENIFVIHQRSKINTYSLMKHASLIITFGTTVGIEAVFWKKASILAGQSLYKNIGGTYNPKSHSELINLINSDLKPISNDSAFMYGYYLNTRGTPYKYYTPIDRINGKFKGHDLNEFKYLKIMLNLLFQIPGFKTVSQKLKII